MVISVTFNNISQANSEILKAFNSTTSAKALEAYQPLDSKQRKLEKLRALQLLKQSSEAETLADISLSTSSLSLALGKAEGATLQAMLNLLSAKMIEQNKYSYIKEEENEEFKAKVQKKLEDNKRRKQKEDEEEQKESQEETQEGTEGLDKLVNAVVTYFEEIRDDFIEKYKKFLDAFSLANIQKAFEEGVKLVKRYTYEAPLEFFNEYVVEPIADFRQNLQDLIDNKLKAKVKQVSTGSFSSQDIKSMLNQSFVKNHKPKASKPKAKAKVDDAKLEKTVSSMDKTSVILRKKIKNRKRLKAHSAEEIKLALHR